VKKISIKEKTKNLVTQIVKTRECKELKEAKKLIDKDNYLQKSVKGFMLQYQEMFSMNFVGRSDQFIQRRNLIRNKTSSGNA